MTSTNLANTSQELITCYGNTAKNVIHAYRVGNARAVIFVEQRWAGAVEKMGTRLNAEIRNNALAAQQKVSSYYTKGIGFGIDSADVVVNKAVELAGRGVEQVAVNASRFEKATGLAALTALAAVAVPAVVAVNGVAAKLEAKSDKLVMAIAGPKPKTKTTAAKRRAVKPSTTKPTVAKRVVAKKATLANPAAQFAE